MPRGKFKHRYWFFTDTPNIARNCRVIWKDLWWWADSHRRLKYRGGCTIPIFQFSVWCEKYVAARHYSMPITGKQFLFANNRNKVRGAVLVLSQDGAWTDLFENLSVNSLKRDQSNDTKINPPLFSLVNTFKLLNNWSKKYQLLLTPICTNLHALALPKESWQIRHLIQKHDTYCTSRGGGGGITARRKTSF